MKSESLWSIFVALFWAFSSIVVIHKRLFCSGEDVQYIIRIFDIGDTCEFPNVRKLSSDIKWSRVGYKQYLSLNFTLDKSTVISRFLMRFIRCQDLEIGCDDFQSWNFTNFCTFLKMKNQIWSETVNSIRPKNWLKDCPRFEQEFYRVENISVDVSKLITFYSDVVKYHWKVYGYAYGPKNELLYCGHLHLRFTSFVAKKPESNQMKHF